MAAHWVLMSVEMMVWMIDDETAVQRVVGKAVRKVGLMEVMWVQQWAALTVDKLVGWTAGLKAAHLVERKAGPRAETRAERRDVCMVLLMVESMAVLREGWLAAHSVSMWARRTAAWKAAQTAAWWGNDWAALKVGWLVAH